MCALPRRPKARRHGILSDIDPMPPELERPVPSSQTAEVGRDEGLQRACDIERVDGVEKGLCHQAEALRCPNSMLH